MTELRRLELSQGTWGWDLAPGDQIVVKIDGGAPQTGTIAAVAAHSDSPGTGPWDLSGDPSLTIDIDQTGGQQIALDSSRFSGSGGDAATAAEVAAQINEQLVGGRAAVAAGILHGDESGTLTTTRRRLASGSGSVTFTGGWGTDPVQINLPNGFSQATGLDYHVVVTAHKSASPGVMFQVQKGSGHFDVEALDPSPSAARNDTVSFDWIALGLSS